MSAEELRELADWLAADDYAAQDRYRAAAYLRACADALDAGPVAWVRRHPDGTITEEFLPHSVIEQVRRDSGAWAALYTLPIPDQAHTLRLPEPMTDDELERTWLGAYGIMAALRTIEAETLRRVKEANK